MAEYVVTLVVERVGELLIKEARFTYGLRDHLEELQAGLRQMRCFLKDADGRQDESETLQNLVIDIREVAYDAEDVLEIFAFKVSARRRRRRREMTVGDGIRDFLSGFGWIFKKRIAVYIVGSKIHGVSLKISKLATRLQSCDIRAVTKGEGPSSRHERQNQLRRSYSHVIEEDFVGFDEEVNILVSKLVGEYSGRRVVSICGMGGLGKTTLAKRVYHHNVIRCHFRSFAWVCISQSWQKMDVLKTILIKLIPERTWGVKKMTDAEVVKLIYEVQQQKKCLVVLDDIWTYDVWNTLRPAFPEGDTGSRILLTTRKKEVAFHIDRHAFVHRLGFLNREESWQLLMKKAFPGRRDFRVDTDMEKKGREMLRRCGGLPIAIVVLGGLLANAQTLNEWDGVNRRIDMYLKRGEGIDQEYQTVQQLLALSYNDLPYELKSCFLYLGNFQENYSVSTEKLYLLWIAEGMIAPEDKGEEETMMDVAERYLGELARRSMIQVESTNEEWLWTVNKSEETCCLHDLMRELCLSKRKKEGIQSHGNVHDSSSSSMGAITKTRKLAVYFGLPIDIPDLKEFKLLRVLDFEGFDFGRMRIPEAIGKLIHLKYLSFRNCEPPTNYVRFENGETAFLFLPASIGNLKFLQILDLRVWGTVSLPNIIWKLERLRHLYLPATQGGGHHILRLDGLSDLEILENFNPKYSVVNDLFKLPKLNNLGANNFTMTNENDVEPLINYLNCTSHQLRQSFLHITLPYYARPNEDLLTKVFTCPSLQKLVLEGNIGKLPEYRHDNFSSSLTRIALWGSELVEDPMTTLEKLPNLQSLLLCYKAYVGKEMVCSAGGFPQLIRLGLQNLSNLENWRVDEGALPTLCTLRIAQCKEMKMLPEGLRFLNNLRELTIEDMSDAFKNKVRGEDSYKIRHVPSVIII